MGNSFAPRSETKQFSGLGTMNFIQAFGNFDSGLLDRAAARVAEIEAKMSAFRAESEITALRQNAGRKPVTVSDETFRLLKRAKEYAAISHGAFDITVRPLVELWGIGKKQSFVPEIQAIKRALALVGDDGLVLDDAKATAFLKKAGQAVDLGSIAKGYAADEVKRLLVNGGVESAMINLGGNILALGSRPDGGPWRIGVQNPAAVRGEYLGTLKITDQTVVTSGSNERFFVKNGKRYHHILDIATGMPAQSGLMSVTVIGKDSAAADALATAVFVLGMEKGGELLRRQGAQAVFATDDYKIYGTEGMASCFTANSSAF